MSRHWTKERARLFGEAEQPVDLVGRDLRADATPRGRARRSPSRWLPVLAGCVVAALMLTSLRLSILRTRYRLAEVAAEETALLQDERGAAVAWRELRDPVRLRELAAARGFAPPEARIELSAPGSETASAEAGALAAREPR